MKDFYKKTDCLSSDQLLRYASQKLDAAGQRSVELHLADCPFCSDALDGIMEAGEMGKVVAGISEIQPMVDQRVQGKKSPTGVIELPLFSLKRKSIRYAIAASILFFAAAGILMNLYLKKTGNLQKEITEQVPEPEQKDVSGKAEEPQEEVAGGEIKSMDETETERSVTGSDRTAGEVAKEASAKTATDKKGYRVEDEMKGAAATKNAAGASSVVTLETAESKPAATPPPQPSAAIADVPAGGPEKAAEGEVAEREIAQNRNGAEDLRQQETNKKGKKEEKRKSESFAAPAGGQYYNVAADAALASGDDSRNVPAALDSAIRKYDARDYDGSLAIIEMEVFTQEQSNYDGLFYAGMANVKKDSCQKAMEYFNRLLLMKSLKHYHEALFNKAQCLLKMNRTDEARKALEELSTRENRYRKPAMDILEEINK